MAETITPIGTSNFSHKKNEISSPTGTFDSTFSLDDLLTPGLAKSGVHTPITPFTPFSPKHKEAALDAKVSEDDEVPPAYAATPHKGKEVLLSPAVFSTDVKSDVKAEAKPVEESKLIKFRGKYYNITQVEAMRGELNVAIQNDELPQYDTLILAMHHVLDDYSRLLDMRLARGDQPVSSWETDSAQRSLRISFAANLQSRSQAMRRDLAEANTKTRVDNMVKDTSSDARLYGLIQHALKDAIKNQAIDGRHSVDNVNMEAVFEELFGIIEAGFLDAAGPLRLNNNLLNQTSTVMNETSTAMHQATGTLTETSTAIHQQVDAISHHVGAIRNHVGALGSHFGAMDNNLSSVSNNVSTLGTQISMLQTVINLLPNMVQQAVNDTIKESLAQASQNVVGPLLTAQIEKALRKTVSLAVTQPVMSERISPRKSKRWCFFSWSSKKNCRGSLD